MDKLLLVVYVPLISKEYEVFVPINKTIGETITLLNKSVNELTNGNYPKNNNSALYEKETGALLNNKALIKESGLLNGSKVILI